MLKVSAMNKIWYIIKTLDYNISKHVIFVQNLQNDNQARIKTMLWAPPGNTSLY